MPLCSRLSPGGSDRRGDSWGWSCGAWGGGRSLLTGATYIRSNHFFISSHTNQILLQNRSQMQIGHHKWLALKLWPPAWDLGPHILALGIFTFPSHSSWHPVIASQVKPACLAPKIQNLLTENSHPLIIREGGANCIHQQHHAVCEINHVLDGIRLCSICAGAHVVISLILWTSWSLLLNSFTCWWLTSNNILCVKQIEGRIWPVTYMMLAASISYHPSPRIQVAPKLVSPGDKLTSCFRHSSCPSACSCSIQDIWHPMNTVGLSLWKWKLREAADVLAVIVSKCGVPVSQDWTGSLLKSR